MRSKIETLQDKSSAARLARLEAHINGCILRGTSCDYYSELHKTKLGWATNRINKDWRERYKLTIDLVVEVTTCLNQGESRIQSIERACTVRASDIRSEIYRIQSSMDNQSTLSTNHISTPPHEPVGLDQGEPVQPSGVQQEGGVPPPCPAPIPVEPLQETPRPPMSTTPVDRGFSAIRQPS